MFLLSSTYVLDFNGGIIWFFITLPIYITCSIRRLHDTGRSGWTMLYSLIPVIAWIPLIICLFFEGNPDSNKYGQPIKLSASESKQRAETIELVAKGFLLISIPILAFIILSENPY